MALTESNPRTAGRTARRTSIAMGEYDRTRPLIDGRVSIDGIEPEFFLDPGALFCLRPVYEEFDVAEMSLSWYVAARDRGEPLIALPIFPLRMPVLAYIFCRADAPFARPQDLIGKRIGGAGYRFTVNLWLRGIFQEHYGVAPEQLKWVTPNESEGAGYAVPPGIDLTVRPGADPQELLLAGEIDAIISPEIPDLIVRRDPRLRRLFPDTRAELVNYVKKTKIVPITHTLVIGEALLAREPWIASSLVRAFREAQNVCDETYLQPANISLFDGVVTVNETRRDFGDQPYTHGLRANRHILEPFVRYALEQGYITKLPALDDIFVPVDDD